jgi:hypothetical protein
MAGQAVTNHRSAAHFSVEPENGLLGPTALREQFRGTRPTRIEHLVVR